MITTSVMKDNLLKKDPDISLINPAAIPRIKQHVSKEEAEDMWRKKMEYQKAHPKIVIPDKYKNDLLSKRFIEHYSKSMKEVSSKVALYEQTEETK